MEKPSFSLVDLKGISKPIEKLIDTVSKGIGGIYRPVGIVREAKAKAKGELILATAKGKVGDVEYRAAERITYLERRRQRNIEKIISGAAKELPKSVSDNPVREDWAVRFFQD